MRSSPLTTLALSACAIVAPLALVTTAPVAAYAQVQRDAEAESFVNTEASRALKILGNGNPAAEKQAFHTFVDEVADVPRITNFVLGKYSRSLSPAQYAEFAQVFRTYADSVYEGRLGDYHGERLEVLSSAVRKPGDVVVTSRVSGGRIKTPVQVLWRVIRNADGKYRVVDVSLDGIWLAITEQQDFVSTLDNNHGDINVLIRQLRSQLAAGKR